MKRPELRDSWVCPNCGCGVCGPRGFTPAEKVHAPCRREYEFDGPCECSDDYEEPKDDEE